MTLYALLNKAGKNKLDTLLRKAYKQALGLPPYTSTDRLLKLGEHNTVDELIEGHLLSQRYRLTGTDAGRALLLTLGINIPDRPLETTVDIPRELRQNISGPVAQKHAPTVPRGSERGES